MLKHIYIKFPINFSKAQNFGKVIAITATLILLTLSATAQPGALDLSFNIGTGADSNVWVTRVQPDGKILVAGDFNNFNGEPASLVTRLNLDGSADTSFYLRDLTLLSNPFTNRVYDVLVQPDEKILMGGLFSYATQSGDTINHLIRLLPNGNYDSTFANNFFFGNMKCLALQPDGKILIGGNHITINGLPYGHLTRLHPNGDLDTTFNTQNGLNGSVETIAIQPDGKIMFGGSFTSFFGVQGYRIARANADGSADNTFNPGIGGAGSNVQDIELLPDGRMMIGGQFGFYNGTTVGYMVRARTNGSIDFTFRNNPGANLPVYAIKMLPDSGFFAGGSFTAYYGAPAARIAKITADGYVDTLFNTGSGADDDVLTIATQSDDKVLVGGRYKTFNGTSQNRIARLYNCLTPQPDSIAGLTYAECKGTPQTYSVNPVAGATKYEWTLPSGWTGSSDSATITVISNGSGGAITVKAFTPRCGFSYATNLSVTTLNKPSPAICMVTVDSQSTHNIIVWEKQHTNLIDSFCIYRETSANVYTKIASVPFDSLSEYHDYSANPNVTSYRYKLSSIDTCGVESQLSPFHRTIHLQNLANGNFQWTFYQIEGQTNPVISFNFYRDIVPNGNFFPIGNIPGTNATYTDITFSSFPDANYVVDADWNIACTPSRGPINTTRSNIRKDKAGIELLGINELNDASVEVFPNPAASYLFISAASGLSSVKFINALGQNVLNENISGNNYVVNTAALPNGMYVVVVQTTGGEKKVRVIKR